MVAPALLALALGALGVVAAPVSPEGPLVSVSAPEQVVVQIPFNVTCSIGRSVPVTNVTNVTITANDREWSLGLSPAGRQATVEVTVNKNGTVQLGCTVPLGNSTVRANATVRAFYVPVPLLDVANATEAGTELRGSCSVPPRAAKDVQVKVAAQGRGDLVGFGKPPVSFVLQVTEEDAEKGLRVTCEARMEPFMPRNKSQEIRVLVKPRLDVERCPAQQNWTEGQNETLSCSARGSPEPQVSCSKDGSNSLQPGSFRPAERAHAGTYLCRATNHLGTAERNVTVWVQHVDSVPLLQVLLGTLVPVAVILGAAGLLWYLWRTQKIGEYWLWKKHSPPDSQPLRPQGGSAAAPNGCAAP